MVRTLALAVALLAALPASAAGPTAIGSPGGPTMVGATKGWTVWSERPRGSRLWTLIVRGPDGSRFRPVVPPRTVPFDIDLGTDASGDVVATYSRCSAEPTPTGGANPRGAGGLPQYTTGRGCSIRILGLVSGQETRLGRPGTDQGNVLPSMSGTKLAYIAIRARGRAVLVVRDMQTAKKTELQVGKRRRAGVLTSEGPTSVDTDGRAVTSAWRRRARGSFDTAVYVQRLSERRPTLVTKASSDRDTPYITVVAPVLSSNRVHYLLSYGRGFCERRWTRGAGRPAYGLLRSRAFMSPVSAAIDGSRLVVAESQSNRTNPTRPTTAGQIVAFEQRTFTSRPSSGHRCG